MSEQEIFDADEALEEFRALMQDPAARQAFVELKAEKEKAGARMRYEHIMKAVAETPWAIRPSMLGVIIDLLAFRAEGGRFDSEEIEQRIGARRRPAMRSQTVVQSEAPPRGVAVLPLHGVLIPRASMLAEISGATSVESFRAMFHDAVNAAEVSTIVIDVDSPGGMVDQIPEMAAEIRAARATKRIVAVANTEAASGAYWLASQAQEFVVSPSARVGSIGVITAHDDISKAQEIEGIKTTLITAGKYKGEGNPFEPLSDGARAHVQHLVDEYYGMFVADVAAGRGASEADVRAGFGQGRMVAARDALTEKMADQIGTLEGVIGRELGSPPEEEQPSLPEIPDPALAGALDVGEVSSPEVQEVLPVTSASGQQQMERFAAELAALSK